MPIPSLPNFAFPEDSVVQQVPQPGTEIKYAFAIAPIAPKFCPLLLIANYVEFEDCFCIHDRCALWNDYVLKCGLIMKER